MPVTCPVCLSVLGHSKTCSNHPNFGKRCLNYDEGIGDVRFHRLDGKSFTLQRVQYDTLGPGITEETKDDLSGEFEDGRVFHVPFAAWWEVVYE